MFYRLLIIQGYGGTGDDKRVVMNPANLTMIRRFNHHSTMVLKACEQAGSHTDSGIFYVFVFTTNNLAIYCKIIVLGTDTVEPLQTGTTEYQKPLETEQFCQSQNSVFLFKLPL